MSYAQPQRDLRQYSVGLAAVVAFHVLLAYALATGLARKVVEVLGVIDGVAFESNILALNAAVGATTTAPPRRSARHVAADHRIGFAVARAPITIPPT